jgi:hypothetical protein
MSLHGIMGDLKHSLTTLSENFPKSRKSKATSEGDLRSQDSLSSGNLRSSHSRGLFPLSTWKIGRRSSEGAASANLNDSTPVLVNSIEDKISTLSEDELRRRKSLKRKIQSGQISIVKVSAQPLRLPSDIQLS